MNVWCFHMRFAVALLPCPFPLCQNLWPQNMIFFCFASILAAYSKHHLVRRYYHAYHSNINVRAPFMPKKKKNNRKSESDFSARFCIFVFYFFEKKKWSFNWCANCSMLITIFLPDDTCQFKNTHKSICVNEFESESVATMICWPLCIYII